MQMTEIRVWDPLVRTGHWLLATAVIIAWFIDEPLGLHSWLGYFAIVLVVVRIVWGFVGPDYARFASFVRGPRLTFGYFSDLIRFSSKRYLGHSPAGAVMIIALLVMVAVTAVTGMASLAATRGEGPLAGVITKIERLGDTDPGSNQHGGCSYSGPASPFTLAVTPDGRTLYVTGGAKLLTPIRISNNYPGAPIVVGDGPNTIAFAILGRSRG